MLVHVSSYSACLQLINHFLSCSCSCPFFKRTLQWAKIKMWGQGSGQGWFHTNHSILSIPASFPEGDGLIRIEVRLCTSFFKLCNALLHGRETYTYYWKKQTNKQTKKKQEVQTCVITWWHIKQRIKLTITWNTWGLVYAWNCLATYIVLFCQ